MSSIAATSLVPSPWRATGAALCANLVGIGIARFGYTPLIPALIAAGWFEPSAAVYLGAANLAGYLVGALGARAVAVRLDTNTVLRGAMLLTAASLFACASPLGFAWFFVWRFVSGCTGGTLMALAAPSVLPGVPAARRGIAGGAIFTGVGLGIAGSGTLVPLLMHWGLVETWLGLGGAALLLTAASWRLWPASAPGGAPVRATPPRSVPALRALYVEYALNAVGLVPHMVFLVDFVARGLGRGLAVGAGYWIVFGIGALVGPLIGGHVGDRIGFRATLRWTIALQAVAVALPLCDVSAAALAVSSFVAGASVPGVVAVTNGRVRELAAADAAVQAAAWSWCTIAFAIGQAIAGYGFSFIFARAEHAYAMLFALGAAALLAALLVDFAAARTLRRVSRG